ncbi:MAG: hypothetical protein GOV00_02775 [Candidatus Altiarchaeota archaeon]|nr:hypothetical protein [Candidatus Altiarchaeota archaeon]
MGIVRKILGDEKLTKNELINMKEEETSRKEVGGSADFGAPSSFEKVERATENVTTSDLIPKGIEMFVRLDDYNKIVSHLKRLDTVIERLEELEKSHSDIQEINDKFVEQLEHALSEVEEVKDGLGENLRVQNKPF